MKRVLVVTYYFPPSGGSGVQRVLKFVKYLRDFGYEPTVLTVKEGAYPQHDTGLAAEIPAGVVVCRTQSLDPFGIYARLTGRSRKDAVMVGTVRREGGFVERAARWIRANVFLPDARVGWVPFAVRGGTRLHKKHPFDVVLTSGPPHSIHLIGRKLKRRLGLPWVADFRDPWNDISYYQDLPMNRSALRFAQHLERSVLTEADRLVTVSPSWKKMLVEKSGRAAEDVTVIHNGFDEDDFPAVSRTAAQNSEEFILAHVGSLSGPRNPWAFWAAIKRLHEAGRINHLRVRLVGMVDPRVRQAITSSGLDEVVDTVPYVSHRDAVRMMCEADALLLVLGPFDTDVGLITGKLYEYFASGSHILALGPAEGDAAHLLDETKSGHILSWDDVAGTSNFILELYERWEQGDLIKNANSSNIMPYSRREETRQLAELLTESFSRA